MVLGKNIKIKVKVKVVILKTLPPSLEQAGSVLLPMVDYSLGGDGGGDFLTSFSATSIRSSTLPMRVRTSSVFCSMRFIILSEGESQLLELLPHGTSVLEIGRAHV